MQVWDTTTGKERFTHNGHTAQVGFVAWSPDGTKLASASQDGTDQVWTSDIGTVLKLHQAFGKSWGISWSPDGTRIASTIADYSGQASSPIVDVWDPTTGATKLTYRAHTANVWTAEWSPDGHQIASASGDGTVRVWNATTGATTLIYRGHSGPVYFAAWSPDGSKIASGGKDGTTQVWSPTT